jgi:hypothetical protein
MRAKLSAILTRRLSKKQRDEVGRWWSGLAQADRRALSHDPARAPVGVLARFVEAGAADDDWEDSIDFYEYLVNHELYLEDGRIFHICSAHPEARALVAREVVPAGFECPRADAACPMRGLRTLAAGRDVRLSLVSVNTLDEEGTHE